MTKLKRKRDWIGRFVQLQRRVSTLAGKVLEAGTVVEVLGNHGGLRLRTLAFDSAWQGQQVVKGVAERDVLLLHLWTPRPGLPFVTCGSCGMVRCADGSNDRTGCRGNIEIRNGQ